jgi:hypothetical protein
MYDYLLKLSFIAWQRAVPTNISAQNKTVPDPHNLQLDHERILLLPPHGGGAHYENYALSAVGWMAALMSCA